jgi:gluconate 2-dehydrogenase gamma chain
MNTRRDALRLLTWAPAALPALGGQTKEVGDQPGHLHEAAPLKAPIVTGAASLQPPEVETLEALSERIIPHSDTPGAKEAGVPLLIDKLIGADPTLLPLYRGGLADLNALSRQEYGKNFVALTEAEQITVLTPLSLDPNSALGEFFKLVKNMTIDAYYRTEAGLKIELGWHGNTYLASFPGCDHPDHQS